MSTAFSLDDYFEAIELLPAELRRNLRLMCDLDERSNKLVARIDEKANDFADTEHFDSEEQRQAQLRSIQADFTLAKAYADDKVLIAEQTYALVEKKVRKLDLFFARFNRNKAAKKTEQEEGACKKGGRKDKNAKVEVTKKRSDIAAGGDCLDEKDKQTKQGAIKKVGPNKDKNAKMEGKKKQPIDLAAGGDGNPSDEASLEENQLGGSDAIVGPRKRTNKAKKAIADSEGGSTDTSAFEMPVDPNEPTYCLCKQVFFGNMIACDYAECPVEWYHFECLGLKKAPKGKWFCPKCLPKSRKTKTE